MREIIAAFFFLTLELLLCFVIYAQHSRLSILEQYLMQRRPAVCPQASVQFPVHFILLELRHTDR